jgi:hypothetical protein
MKSASIIFCLALVLACTNRSNGPYVSGIKVEMTVERFDRDFFSMDTISMEKSISDLQLKYPTLMPIFLYNILGLDSASQYEVIPRFLRQSRFLYDSAARVFENFDDVKKEFEQAFRYVKYYFPNYQIPELVTIIGPIDALAVTASGEPTPVFIGPDFIGINLQFYLGKNFSLYHDVFFIAHVAPEFRSRRFEKKYIAADAMKLVADDIYPDKSSGKGLVEQMIEKGKQWWLLDKFLPAAPDSIKTGYTQQHLDWCSANEGMVWSTILTNEKDIFTREPATIQNYIGEAPFTQTLSPASPGNIGQWIGWQIVKKFAEKNSSLSIDEVMRTEPKKILDEAKYKPK